MNILDTIIAQKYKEVEQIKQNISTLEKSPLFDKNSLSLKKKLQEAEKWGIIAEFKRRSPSKGFLKADAEVVSIASAYQEAGAMAVSILTDELFFAGSTNDLIKARPHLEIPILRKDFIIDEAQIIEAKSLGADIILLISACLDGKRLKELAKFAKSLELEVLMEVHHLTELQETLNEYVDMVGVNNRNLKTFEVSIQTSLELVNQIPSEFIKISESGLSELESLTILNQAGYKGFLMGETFMRAKNPAEMLQKFVV